MVQILEKWAGPDWDTISKARQGRQGGRTEVKAVGDSGHRFAWVESMKAWACEECGKTKRVGRHKIDRERCKVKFMGGAGDCGVGKGEEMHRSHCVWKGWGEEGLPPTNVCDVWMFFYLSMCQPQESMQGDLRV